MPAARTLRLSLLLGLAALGVGWQPPTAVAQADHLLISEIVMQIRPPAETFGTKYVEIVNPTGEPVDLSDVYLTDATNAPTTIYAKIVTGQDAGGGTSGDFHARFPDGAVIAAGDTIVVALLGSTAYQQGYGRLPDFELYEDGLAPDAVPELVPAFPGAIGAGLGSGGSNPVDLSTTAESIVLYRWDGQSDLVQDLDYAFWGTVASVRVDKTGLTVDGPDAGEETSTYLLDTTPSSQQPIAAVAHPYAGSFRRTGAVEAGETATGGNGITGDDETSERLATSWLPMANQDPPAAPAALLAPAPVVLSTALTPTQPRAGRATTVTVGLVSYHAVAGVSAWYRVDGGLFTEAAGTGAAESWTVEIPALPQGAVVDWYVRAVSDQGASATRPVAAPRYHETFVVAEESTPSEAAHLLLTEIAVLGNSQEFIEITNPTDQDVNLGNYYLTDANHTSNHYWNIVLPNPASGTVGGGAFNDFHARFPADAVIAAGDTITISIPGSNAFAGAFGFLPDYELYEDGTEPDDVPDLLEVFPGSIVGETTPTLTNATEIVILYYWNGETDLVTDVDVFMWGTGPTNFFSKTGISMDGPDADAIASAYNAETAVGQQRPYLAAHDFGQSYQRRPVDEGESTASGNGVGGHDELSENLPQTWTIADYNPAAPDVPSGGGDLVLKVPARTFLPVAGQRLPIRFITRAGTHTALRIFDLEGRLVLTLFDSMFDGVPSSIPGQYTLVSWDGRDAEFERVRAGLYVIHLSSVDPRSGDRETKTAPAVVGTRLGD